MLAGLPCPAAQTVQIVRAIAQATHVGHVNEFLTKIAMGSWPAIFGTEGGYAAEDVETMANRRLDAFGRGFSA